jgi:hypothetical protein
MGGTMLLAVVMTIVLLIYDDPFAWMGDWGYPGAFLVMLVNNPTIILPAFGHAFIAAPTQTLNPWLLGLVGGLSAAAGEASSYVVGRSGGKTVRRRLFALSERTRGLRRNLMGPMLFLFALTPPTLRRCRDRSRSSSLSVRAFHAMDGRRQGDQYGANRVGQLLHTIEWLSSVLG